LITIRTSNQHIRTISDLITGINHISKCITIEIVILIHVIFLLNKCSLGEHTIRMSNHANPYLLNGIVCFYIRAACQLNFNGKLFDIIIK